MYDKKLDKKKKKTMDKPKMDLKQNESNNSQ